MSELSPVILIGFNELPTRVQNQIMKLFGLNDKEFLNNNAYLLIKDAVIGCNILDHTIAIQEKL